MAAQEEGVPFLERSEVEESGVGADTGVSVTTEVHQDAGDGLSIGEEEEVRAD